MFRVAIKEHWSSFNKFWLAEALDYISRAGGIVAIRIIGAAETHSLSFSGCRHTIYSWLDRFHKIPYICIGEEDNCILAMNLYRLDCLYTHIIVDCLVIYTCLPCNLCNLSRCMSYNAYHSNMVFFLNEIRCSHLHMDNLKMVCFSDAY
jgi:hypothetical protein